MEIVSRVNWVDVLALILILRISYVAFKDGLSHEIFPLISSVFILLIALYYYNKIALYISQNISGISLQVSACVSFISLVVVSGIVLKLIRALVDKIIKVTWHPAIERLGGLFAGIARAMIVTSIVLIIIALMPFPYLQHSIKDRSLTGMQFLRVGPEVYAKVMNLIPRAKGIEEVTVSALVRDIIADKRIATKAKKNVKKAPEWERALGP